MIISCPACSKRYVLDAALLGSGRKVRCANCGNAWQQRPPPAPPPESVATFAAPRPVQAPPPDIPEDWDTPADDNFDEPPPQPKVRPLPRSLAPAREEEAAEARRRRKRLQWASLAAVAAFLIVGVLAGRDGLIAAWPASARLYDALHMGVAPAGAGLKLQEVSTQAREVEGNPMLFISGQISNASQSQQVVPEIKAEALGPNKAVLATWRIKPSLTRLFPGQVATFQSAVPDSGRAATEMRITFADAKG
jgi:predicted Zn finger-like uncharacterized protein